MQFDSIRLTLRAARQTMMRFPAPLLSAATFAAAVILLQDSPDSLKKILINVALISSLGISAFTGLAIFCERYRVRLVTRLVFNLGLGILLGLYYLYLPVSFERNDAMFYFLMWLISHLFVSFGPFLVNEEINGFWQYNRLLFIRILTSSLYSIVLFGGLALALMAIDQLFPIRVPYEWYFRLFVLIGALFNTLFFLAGAPENLDKLEQDNSYPGGLRVFTQYVLLPLVSIYLLILYAYALRILLTMNWPEGWVAYLVLGFSIAGILALLLIWPLRSIEVHRWIGVFARFFFLALLPLIILLSLSIYIRVSDYGITEPRFFVIVLSVWLLINALYFLFSKRKHIKIIPLTLALAAFLSAFGPLNAFRVSRNWQKSRLAHQLEGAGMLDGDKWKDNVKAGNDAVADISNTLFYLVNNHGVSSVASFFPFSADSVAALHPSSPYEICRELMESRGLTFSLVLEQDGIQDRQFYYYSRVSDTPLKTSGYDYFFTLYVSEYNESRSYPLDSALQLTADVTADKRLILRIAGQDAMLNLDSLQKCILTTYGQRNNELPASVMTLLMKAGDYEFKLICTNFSGLLGRDEKLDEVNNFSASVLVKVPASAQ